MTKSLPYILVVVVLLLAGGFYINATSDSFLLGKTLIEKPLDKSLAGDRPMPKIDFKDQGKAPEFTGIEHWLNSDPLTMESLRGKVVLVDFWTYSCINCIRTLPYVTKWYDTYKDKGFVVVGVHTPEFAFEKDTNNVAASLPRFKIHYPVAQDNDYKTWNAFNNQYWPAEYLINKDGHIVHTHFGEGEYDQTEDAIRTLLGLNGGVAQEAGSPLDKVQSPEMYFGTSRLANLESGQRKFIGKETFYNFPSSPLPLNTFALEGSWAFYLDKAVLAPGSEGSGKIRLHFKAGKVHMVADSGVPLVLKITVDGKPQPNVTVNKSQLYTLFDSDDYGEHTMEIEIPLPGNFEVFTFTFG